MLRAAVVVLCAVAAATLAAPNPDHPGNDALSSYGPPISPAHAAAGAAGSIDHRLYQPVRYENSGYGAAENTYETQEWGASGDAGAELFPGPLGAVIGYKLGAVGLVVRALGWLVGHAWAAVLGAIATFAFCKVTAVCDLSYHKHVAEHLHEQVRSLVTPERLASASRMLDSAMSKYAAKKKAYSKNN